MLGMPWLQENGVSFDIWNSKVLIGDNFAIPFEDVEHVPVPAWAWHLDILRIFCQNR
jgi:hypothetical protein